MIQVDKLPIEWIRQKEVNILNYLPHFLANDKTFKTLADSHSKEHERIRLIVTDLINQFFVSTATWGLKLWERELYITPKATDTIEERRRRIWLKLQSHQTSTLDFMNDLINRYIEDKSGYIEEVPQDYAIKIFMKDNQVKNWGELLEAINLWIPAHIAYKFFTYMYLSNCIYFGGVVSYNETESIPYDTSQLTGEYTYNGSIILGGLVSTAERFFINT